MLLFVAPTSAQAQSATAQAETLFRQGKELMGKGKFAEACAAFDASQRLDPTLATLLNQASCREKNGQLATAWGLFLDAERQARNATDEPTRKLHRVATSHAARLEPKLSTLAINVTADNRVAGLEILRNSEVIDPGAWNKSLPVDGGTYQITARAPGNTDWTTTVNIGIERDAKVVETPKLKAAELKPASPEPTPTVHTVTAEPAAPTRGRMIVLPIALGIGSLALAGTAIGFGVSSSSTYDKSKREIDNAKQDDLWESANTKRKVAIGMGIGSVVCAGAAVGLYLWRGRESAAPTETTWLFQPVIGGNVAGLAVGGTY